MPTEKTEKKLQGQPKKYLGKNQWRSQFPFDAAEKIMGLAEENHKNKLNGKEAKVEANKIE